ncbi:MAG TPA: hypothetical protein VMI35_10025 [Puia sp.]|nr:hypothetical protein [Puia sp.]
MNTQDPIEERLWNFIDGQCGPEEKSAIETMIAAHVEWQRKYHELLRLQQLLTQSELDAPSLRFTRNVMEQIAKYHVAPATRSYINKKIIWGIGGFFIATILGFLIYGFGQMHWSAAGSSNDVLTQYTNKLDWSRLLNNAYTNICIGINVVLGLVLLDMYLQRKKEQKGAAL